jgi:hypothetical protein
MEWVHDSNHFEPWNGQNRSAVCTKPQGYTLELSQAQICLVCAATGDMGGYSTNLNPILWFLNCQQLQYKALIAHNGPENLRRRRPASGCIVSRIHTILTHHMLCNCTHKLTKLKQVGRKSFKCDHCEEPGQNLSSFIILNVSNIETWQLLSAAIKATCGATCIMIAR